MSINRYRSNTASDNIVVYLQTFDKSVSIIDPDTTIPDLTGFDVEATIFVNADDFRSQFLIDISANSFKCISGNINLRDPTDTNTFVDINPTKANAAKYTDMCENYIHFNGSSPYNDGESMSISNVSTKFKVCHDYAKYLVQQSTGSPEIDYINNANEVIADILSKGQLAVIEFLNNLKKVDYNQPGYNICNEIALQIKTLNEDRLKSSGDSSIKYQLKNHDPINPWQELPLISGDVVCFKFTCNDISGTDIRDEPKNIPSRTYLIKLCLIEKEDQWARNLKTYVGPYDDDTITKFYTTAISEENPNSLFEVHSNTTDDILKGLYGPTILNHYEKKQYVRGSE